MFSVWLSTCFLVNGVVLCLCSHALGYTRGLTSVLRDVHQGTRGLRFIRLLLSVQHIQIFPDSRLFRLCIRLFPLH